MAVRIVEYRGERITLAELSRRCGIAVPTLYQRIFKQGAAVATAAETPVAKRPQHGGRPAVNVPRQCPRMKRHSSGRAYVRWKMNGRVRERYLGAHGSTEAATAYRKFATDWAGGQYDPRADGDSVGGESVAGLSMRWLEHCQKHYVKDGKTTSELSSCRAAARTLVALHGESLAGEFTPAKLRECQAAFVAQKVCRNTVNSYTARIVRCFRWAAGQSIVSAAVYTPLELVEPLARGRTEAKDYERRKPVTDVQIEATIPHLSPAHPERSKRLAAMVRLQRLTGMRPGDVCALAVADLDMSGDVWRYTVGKTNKNLHRGRALVYYLGPKSVEILKPFVASESSGTLFGVPYDQYALAVQHASVKSGAGRWSPHQLRHALATEVAEKFRTLEHAAAAIGDSEAVAQAVYVHMDPREKAKIEVARRMG